MRIRSIFLYPLGTRRFAIPSHVNSSASPHVVTDMGSVPTGRVEVYVYRNGSIRRTKMVWILRIKYFLIFPYIGCLKGTKMARRILSEYPCILGIRRSSRVRMKKRINRSGLCVSTFFEPTKYSDEEITEKSKFLRVVQGLL